MMKKRKIMLGLIIGFLATTMYAEEGALPNSNVSNILTADLNKLDKTLEKKSVADTVKILSVAKEKNDKTIFDTTKEFVETRVNLLNEAAKLMNLGKVYTKEDIGYTDYTSGMIDKEKEYEETKPYSYYQDYYHTTRSKLNEKFAEIYEKLPEIWRLPKSTKNLNVETNQDKGISPITDLYFLSEGKYIVARKYNEGPIWYDRKEKVFKSSRETINDEIMKNNFELDTVAFRETMDKITDEEYNRMVAPIAENYRILMSGKYNELAKVDSDAKLRNFKIEELLNVYSVLDKDYVEDFKELIDTKNLVAGNGNSVISYEKDTPNTSKSRVSENNIVIGDKNKVDHGSNNSIIGSKNTIENDHAGMYSYIPINNTNLFGRGNTVKGDYTNKNVSIIGNENKVNSNWGEEIPKKSLTIIGSGNDITNKAGLEFSLEVI